MAAPKLDSVLVVGGCGFLGHHLVQRLLADEASDVSVLDLRTTRNRVASVQYYDGDISSAGDVASVLQKVKPQVIFHTASPVAADHNPRSLYDRVNVQGTKNLLEGAAKVGTVVAFVYTSSASVVHDNVHDLVMADESYPVLRIPQQHDYYSHTKGVADSLVLAANRGDSNPRMLTACIRPAGIFGEGDIQLTKTTVEVYQGGQTWVQIGNNENDWDFTYVGNVVHAHVLAARALLATAAWGGAAAAPLDHERVDGQAFFVTNDEPTPFWTLMRKFWTAAGWQGEAQGQRPWVLPAALGLWIAWLMDWVYWLLFQGRIQPRLKKKGVDFSVQRRTYSIAKAKRVLGYRPLVGLDDGIKRAVDHCLAQQQMQKKQELEEKKAA